MWKTRRGNINVTNGLRALFAASVAALLAELKPHRTQGEPLSTGIAPFDLLTREQQIVAVCEVGMSLLKKDVPVPESASYRQATLLAIFHAIEQGIRLEILGSSTAFRLLLLSAHRELYGLLDHGVNRDCPDFEQWKAFVASVRDKLLGTNCLEISDKIMDLPKDLSASVYAAFGIPENYYLAFPDDPAYLRTVEIAMKTLERCNECLAEYMTGLREKLHDDLATAMEN